MSQPAEKRHRVLIPPTHLPASLPSHADAVPAGQVDSSTRGVIPPGWEVTIPAQTLSSAPVESARQKARAEALRLMDYATSVSLHTLEEFDAAIRDGNLGVFAARLRVLIDQELPRITELLKMEDRHKFLGYVNGVQLKALAEVLQIEVSWPPEIEESHPAVGAIAVLLGHSRETLVYDTPDNFCTFEENTTASQAKKGNSGVQSPGTDTATQPAILAYEPEQITRETDPQVLEELGLEGQGSAARLTYITPVRRFPRFTAVLLTYIEASTARPVSITALEDVITRYNRDVTGGKGTLTGTAMGLLEASAHLLPNVFDGPLDVSISRLEQVLRQLVVYGFSAEKKRLPATPDPKTGRLRVAGNVAREAIGAALLHPQSLTRIDWGLQYFDAADPFDVRARNVAVLDLWRARADRAGVLIRTLEENVHPTSIAQQVGMDPGLQNDSVEVLNAEIERRRDAFYVDQALARLQLQTSRRTLLEAIDAYVARLNRVPFGEMQRKFAGPEHRKTLRTTIEYMISRFAHDTSLSRKARNELKVRNYKVNDEELHTILSSPGGSFLEAVATDPRFYSFFREGLRSGSGAAGAMSLAIFKRMILPFFERLSGQAENTFLFDPDFFNKYRTLHWGPVIDAMGANHKAIVADNMAIARAHLPVQLKRAQHDTRLSRAQLELQSKMQPGTRAIGLVHSRDVPQSNHFGIDYAQRPLESSSFGIAQLPAGHAFQEEALFSELLLRDAFDRVLKLGKETPHTRLFLEHTLHQARSWLQELAHSSSPDIDYLRKQPDARFDTFIRALDLIEYLQRQLLDFSFEIRQLRATLHTIDAQLQPEVYAKIRRFPESPEAQDGKLKREEALRNYEFEIDLAQESVYRLQFILAGLDDKEAIADCLEHIEQKRYIIREMRKKLDQWIFDHLRGTPVVPETGERDPVQALLPGNSPEDRTASDSGEEATRAPVPQLQSEDLLATLLDLEEDASSGTAQKNRSYRLNNEDYQVPPADAEEALRNRPPPLGAVHQIPLGGRTGSFRGFRPERCLVLDDHGKLPELSEAIRDFEAVEIVRDLTAVRVELEDEYVFSFTIDNPQRIEFPFDGYPFVRLVQQGGGVPKVTGSGVLMYPPDAVPTAIRVYSLGEQSRYESGENRILNLGQHDSRRYVPEWNDTEVVALLAETEGDPGLHGVISSCREELLELRQQKLHEDPDIVAGVIKKHLLMLEEYTFRDRYYALDFAMTRGKTRFPALEALGKQPGRGYFCATSGYMVSEFCRLFGLVTHCRGGLMCHNDNGVMVQGSPHRVPYVYLCNGEVWKVDLVPRIVPGKTPAADEEVMRALNPQDMNPEIVISEQTGETDQTAYTGDIARDPRENTAGAAESGYISARIAELKKYAAAVGTWRERMKKGILEKVPVFHKTYRENTFRSEIPENLALYEPLMEAIIQELPVNPDYENRDLLHRRIQQFLGELITLSPADVQALAWLEHYSSPSEAWQALDTGTAGQSHQSGAAGQSTDNGEHRVSSVPEVLIQMHDLHPEAAPGELDTLWLISERLRIDRVIREAGVHVLHPLRLDILSSSRRKEVVSIFENYLKLNSDTLSASNIDRIRRSLGILQPGLMHRVRDVFKKTHKPRLLQKKPRRGAGFFPGRAPVGSGD